MKKSTIGIIVAVVMAIGAALLLVGCVGKSNKTAPADIQITNTYQLRDISKNEMIRDEARERMIVVMGKESIKLKGDVDFIKVVAYKTLRDHHYIVLEFKSKLEDYTEELYALVYLDVREFDGKYSIYSDNVYFAALPEHTTRYQEMYEEVIKTVDSNSNPASTQNNGG